MTKAEHDKRYAEKLAKVQAMQAAEESLPTRESVLLVDGETIEIWRYGVNDYSANYMQGDCSTRGTLMQVLEEIIEAYGPEAIH